jgi:hypothetical protein
MRPYGISLWKAAWPHNARLDRARLTHSGRLKPEKTDLSEYVGLLMQKASSMFPEKRMGYSKADKNVFDCSTEMTIHTEKNH